MTFSVGSGDEQKTEGTECKKPKDLSASEREEREDDLSASEREECKYGRGKNISRHKTWGGWVPQKTKGPECQ